MTAPPEKNIFLRTAWLAVVLMTFAAVWLHFYFLFHAGGLWRDEISAKNVATLPSYGQVWEALPHDHCPIVFPVLVRIWTALGPGTADMGLRILGLACGLSLLAAFWIASRTMDKGLPLLSLALAGLNFTVIRYGDSIRAYGLATVFILLTMSLIWRFIESPTLPRGLLAGLAAVLSVQTLYQNAFFLLSICIAGAAVCLHRHQLRQALAVLSIGLPAALSLLPYLSPLYHAQSWWIVEKTGINWAIFLSRIAEATGMFVSVWLVLIPVAALFGIGCVLMKTSPDEPRVQRDLVMFASIALIMGLAGFGFFVGLSGLPTQRWYYIPAMGFAVVCCDVILPRIHRVAREVVLILAVVVALLAFSPAQSALALTQTNGDLLAAQVSREAGPDDLIIVHPWYDGVTFGNYYHGTVSWTTLPPLEDYRFHRYDLIKAKMQMTNAIEPVLRQAEATLRSGHTVWFVGKIPTLQFNGPPPVDLPPAPQGPKGWADEPYTDAWGRTAAYFLVQHMTHSVLLVNPVTNRVSPMENMALIEISGWHSPVSASGTNQQ